MMVARKLSLAVSLLFLGTGVPLAAQPEAFRALVDALASEERLLAGFGDQATALMLEEAKRDPEMLEMEKECPGALDLMGSASRPHLVTSHKRAVEQYRGKLFDLFSARLSPEHASGAAEFYRSDDGRFVIELAEQNESLENVLEDARNSESGSVSAEAFAADKKLTEERIRARANNGRLSQIGWKLITSPWFASFEKLKPDMHRLELELANDDFTPDEEAAFDKALDEALTAHFEACYAE